MNETFYTNCLPFQVSLSDLTQDKFILNVEETKILVKNYAVLVGRVVASLPGLKFLKNHLPRHIQHEYSADMSQKSKVFSLPMQFKNEGKYEECIDIMDNYVEQLTSLHLEAFGKCQMFTIKIFLKIV